MRTKVTRARPSETLVNANSRSASAKAVQTRSLIQEDDETWLMISRQEKTLTTSSTSKTRVSPWSNGYFLQERLIIFLGFVSFSGFRECFLKFQSSPSKIFQDDCLRLFYFSWHFPLSFLAFSSATDCLYRFQRYLTHIDSLKLTSVPSFHRISIFFTLAIYEIFFLLLF